MLTVRIARSRYLAKLIECTYHIHYPAHVRELPVPAKCKWTRHSSATDDACPSIVVKFSLERVDCLTAKPLPRSYMEPRAAFLNRSCRIVENLHKTMSHICNTFLVSQTRLGIENCSCNTFVTIPNQLVRLDSYENKQVGHHGSPTVDVSVLSALHYQRRSRHGNTGLCMAMPASSVVLAERSASLRPFLHCRPNDH